MVLLMPTFILLEKKTFGKIFRKFAHGDIIRCGKMEGVTTTTVVEK